MAHLAYCDDKSKELEKIMNGSKTMVIEGSKKITAKVIVVDVQNFVKLSEEEITKTIEDNNSN